MDDEINTLFNTLIVGPFLTILTVAFVIMFFSGLPDHLWTLENPIISVSVSQKLLIPFIGVCAITLLAVLMETIAEDGPCFSQGPMLVMGFMFLLAVPLGCEFYDDETILYITIAFFAILFVKIVLFIIDAGSMSINDMDEPSFLCAGAVFTIALYAYAFCYSFEHPAGLFDTCVIDNAMNVLGDSATAINFMKYFAIVCALIGAVLVFLPSDYLRFRLDIVSIILIAVFIYVCGAGILTRGDASVIGYGVIITALILVFDAILSTFSSDYSSRKNELKNLKTRKTNEKVQASADKANAKIQALSDSNKLYKKV